MPLNEEMTDGTFSTVTKLGKTFVRIPAVDEETLHAEWPLCTLRGECYNLGIELPVSATKADFAKALAKRCQDEKKFVPVAKCDDEEKVDDWFKWYKDIMKGDFKADPEDSRRMQEMKRVVHKNRHLLMDVYFMDLTPPSKVNNFWQFAVGVMMLEHGVSTVSRLYENYL